MNINKCHVNSDVQTRDKAFDMIFKMIRQCITVLRQNVSLWKISAQYVKACTIKVRKTVYFQYSKFQKGHNSYKNWRKLTTLELYL